jgi:hypothetical protein
MHSKTVRLGRDSESNEDSRVVLWKACWMVVLVEVAEGQTTQRSFGRRLWQDTRNRRNCRRRILRTVTDTRYSLLVSRRQTLKLERRKTVTGRSFISSTKLLAVLFGMTPNDPSCSALSLSPMTGTRKHQLHIFLSLLLLRVGSFISTAMISRLV